MRVLCVGGTFSPDGGRTSGYFNKLTISLAKHIGDGCPDAHIHCINGGGYDDLYAAEVESHAADVLLWFADVSNDLPKILPDIKNRNPGLKLVQSKNNRIGKYDRSALFARMQASSSAMLVEFENSIDDGRLVGSVLAERGQILLDRSPAIDNVAAAIAKELFRLAEIRLPLKKNFGVTSNPESFRSLNLADETEIPCGAHPGAFGFVRKNHIHEGLDLYGEPGDLVYAMESGTIVCRQPFTGVAAGSEWWGDTECLMIEGESDVINYGEISVMPGLRPGVTVSAGQPIGRLVTVLLKDKGRPRTMLHLERYKKGTEQPIKEWPLDCPQPGTLLNPTSLLLHAMRNAN